MPLELNEAKKAHSGPARPDDDAIRAFLRDDPDWLRGDPALLSELGLRLDAANIIDFGPIALSKVSEAHRRESGERRRLEAIAQANFAAQVQTHAAVVDVLDASSLEDLSRRVDTLARRRFGLARPRSRSCAARPIAPPVPGSRRSRWKCFARGRPASSSGKSRSRSCATTAVAPPRLGRFCGS